MPIVIALNGPPRIGKGWLAHKIAQHISQDVHARIMSFAEPLRQEVLRIERWLGTYDEFKEHVFKDGVTGREKLIALGTSKRAVDIHYWSRRLTNSHLFKEAELVVIDDLGFRDELDWLRSQTNDLITVVMAPSEYSIGCRFKNDSRECVSPIGGFRTTDSNKALELFKALWANRQNHGNSQGADSINEGSPVQGRPGNVGRSVVESGY